MNPIFMSVNVRGLCANLSRENMRNFILSTSPRPWVLGIQEHKTRQRDVESMGRQIWPGAKFIHAPASDGAWADINPHVRGGRGGLSLAFAPANAQMVIDEGIVAGGRAVWAVVDGFHPYPRVGVMCIYAANSPAARCRLWQQIIDDIPASFPWVFMGDFNMMEGDSDASSKTSLRENELILWNQLKVQFDLVDPFEVSGVQQAFSWDNRQKGSKRVLRRLDRFYLSGPLAYSGFSTPPLSSILGGVAVSDHLPIQLSLTLGGQESAKRCFKFNIQHLREDDFQERAKAVWLGQIKPDSIEQRVWWWCSQIDRLSFFLKQYGKEKAAERRVAEHEAQTILADARLELQRDPSNIVVQVEVAEAEAVLKRIDDYRAMGNLVCSRVKEVVFGDKASVPFFAKLRQGAKCNNISRLYDEDGAVIRGQQQLSRRCVSFFHSVLTSEGDSLERTLARDEVISSISKHISLDQQEALDAPVTEHELWAAAQTLAKGKAPGPDGLQVEFYLECWEWFGIDYCAMVEAAITMQSFGSKINMGALTLLPKSGDPLDLNNKRAISLLNVSYKILAKALAIRLKPVLCKLISSNQSAFLPGRFILDNIFLAHETIQWAKDSKQGMVLISVDFMKAYDRVEWDFLVPVLKKLGFGNGFINFVQLLLADASASVLLNGYKSESFPISRSVRQGCPLAPYLFLMVMEALCALLDAEERKGKIKGVLLPDGLTSQLYNFFADDTNITIQAVLEYFVNLIATLNVYHLATGMKVGWWKSFAGWYDAVPRSLEWDRVCEIKWLVPGEVVKMLGTPFGIQLGHEVAAEFICNKLEKNLDSWKSLKLTKAGRVTAVNHVLMASLWYIFSVWTGTIEDEARVHAVLRKFMWKGHAEGSRCTIRWEVVALPKDKGGLGIINIHDQLTALMAKWIVRALQPGADSWKILFRARMAKAKVSAVPHWPWDPGIITSTAPSKCSGSKLFNRAWKAWTLSKTLLKAPDNMHAEDIMACSFWWSPVFAVDGMPLALRLKDAELLRAVGVVRADDCWDCIRNDWCSVEELQDAYDFQFTQPNQWVTFVNSIPAAITESMKNGLNVLNTEDFVVVLSPPEKYVGQEVCKTCTSLAGFGSSVIRPDGHCDLQIQSGCSNCGSKLLGVAQISIACICELNVVISSPVVLNSAKWFAVDGESSCLTMVCSGSLSDLVKLRRIRVQDYRVGGRSTKRRLYGVGFISDLPWDPGEVVWPGEECLWNYQSSCIRKSLAKPPPAHLFSLDRWDLGSMQDIDWADIWLSIRCEKEAYFMWSISHKVFPCNSWRGRFKDTVDQTCPRCSFMVRETPEHLLFECSEAKQAWIWAIKLFCGLQDPLHPHWIPCWRHCLLGEALPAHLNHLKVVWSLLRGSVCHLIWKARCDWVFEKVHRGGVAIFILSFSALITYGRIVWSKILERQHKVSEAIFGKLITEFDQSWGVNGLICIRTDLEVSWRKNFF